MIENYVPDWAHTLPSHLYLEVLPGVTTDESATPLIIKTVGGLTVPNDIQLAAAFLQAEQDIISNFNQARGIIQSTAYYTLESIPTNVRLFHGRQIPQLGILCRGYINTLKAAEKYPLPVERCIKYALDICDGLGEVHQRMFAHRNLNCTSLLLHESGQVHLDGFSMAQKCGAQLKLTVDKEEFDKEEYVEHRFDKGIECLQYISPEHTGRVLHKPDQRSDMYCLGVILYEMLTGAPPFLYEDPLQMVHAHIARQPAQLPSSLSALADIVHTLLSKDPDQRYCTPLGLKADLALCGDLLKKDGRIKQFALRKQDFIAYPRIKGGLHGRQNEVTMFTKAVNAMSEHSSVFLISGPAGIGKTALVTSMLKRIRERGMYGTGKFDEFHSTAKFFGVIAASIHSLLVQSLVLASNNLHGWEERLSKVIAGCEQMFLEMFPDMEMHVKAFTPNQEVPPAESKYRMQSMISDMVAMLSDIAPVILFFDDLQWADQESLELIEVILNSRKTDIFIIGAYRSEMSPILVKTVQTLQENQGDKCITLQLQSFGVKDITDVLCDFLQDRRDRMQSLAKIVFDKTQGNSLFVIQFIASLYRRALLRFNWDQHCWIWDEEAINKIGYTNGLVSFFQNTFHDIAEPTLNMLIFTSLLGTKFDVSLISNFASEYGFPNYTSALNEATTNGFIVFVGGEQYRFIHDKIRQSAFDLSSDEFKHEAYYKVGAYLLNYEDEEHKIMSLLYLKHVPQLVITKAAESEEGKLTQREAITTALKAGIVAKTASAYQSALEYLKLGFAILMPEHWESDNATAFSLATARAECLYLNGYHDEGIAEFARIREMTLTLQQKVSGYMTEVQALASSTNYAQAIKSGLECCRLLGCEVVDVQADIIQCVQLIKTMNPERLLQAEQLTDTNLLLLMDTISSMLSSAFLGDKQAFMFIACKMVSTTLLHGLSPTCGTGMAFFAMFYSTTFKDPENAYNLAKLAVDLCKRFPINNNIKSRIFFTFTAINVWRNHMSDNIKYLETALNAAHASGEYLYVGYITANLCAYSMFIGVNLQELYANIIIWLKRVKETKNNSVLLLSSVMLGYVSLMIGSTTSNDNLNTLDGSFHESLLESADPVATVWYLAFKIETLYMFDFYEAAIELGESHQKLIGVFLGNIHEPRAVAFYALSLLGSLSPNKVEPCDMEAFKERRDQVIEKVKSLYVHMDLWVQHAALNFQHFDYLIQAEIARVEGKSDLALKIYDKAALCASNNSHPTIIGLTSELVTRCMDEAGMSFYAELPLKQAIESYKIWGAVNKVKQLETKYSHILRTKSSYQSDVESVTSATPVESFGENLSSASSSTNLSKPRELDMRTIIKANHVLSKEIALTQLLDKFASIVLENVGAEQAAIVLAEGSSWKVSTCWSVKDEQIEMNGARKNIVNYVQQTRQPLAIDCFEKSDFYDPMLANEIGSALCLPIGLKGNIIGAVYLEHSVERVLQEDRFELLQLLCTQLCISIENAELYKSIKSSEHRYRTFAEGLPIMALSRDSSGKTFANSKLQQFVGISACAEENQIFDEVVAKIHNEDVNRFMKIWYNTVDPDSSTEAEMRIQRATDGTYRWTLCHVTPAFDNQNRVEMMLVTWMDIQELKDYAQAQQLAKAEIEVSEKKYRSLAEAIPQIVWTALANGDVNYFNKRWYEFTGISEEESLGRGYLNVFHPEDIHVWPNLLEFQSDFEVKLRIKRNCGTYRWHLARSIYIPSSSGVKRCGSFTDIEDQIQIEVSLNQARTLAEKAARNQALFVANMSHEIRTPLNGIVGMLNLMLDTDLTAEQRDHGDTMQRSANALLRIVDDVLDFSKIQEGKVELINEVISVEDIMEDVIENQLVLAVEAELMFYMHRDVPARLIGDSGKLRQVIMNLVGNAVKFAPLGEIILSCVVVSSHEKEVMLKFQVSDTGVGIDQEQQQRLFSPFYQVDSSTTRTFGGTGLGLAICKQLVTLFGGEISVLSNAGKGSTFTFTARFQIADDQPPPIVPSMQSWRALVISNLPMSSNIIREHLHTCKIPVTIVTSEQAAASFLQQNETTQDCIVNCVVVDMISHMGASTEPSKEFMVSLSKMKVILIATSMQRTQLQTEYPFATVIAKPLKLKKLVDALQSRVIQTAKTIPKMLAHDNPASCVLIVEDNAVNQKVISMHLTKRKLSHCIANNGLEAVQMVSDKPMGHFKLILMDLAMPVWDGFRATSEIRNLEDKSYRHPIVALTANVQDGVITSCKECGMDDFLSKPIDFKRLASILDKYLT